MKRGLTDRGKRRVWGIISGALSDQTDLQAALDAKQATLVSATNIKTINGSTVLGSGDLVVGGAAAWGAITGTLSAQTDLQSALDGKQTSGTYATGTGTADGTNTGDNATNTQYSGLAASKQDTLVSGTNIKTVNGSTLLGSGNLSVSASDPVYSPGSFTVATESWRIQGKRVNMTTTQRITVAGTGRLRVSN